MTLSRIVAVIALLAAAPACAQSPAKDEDHSIHHPATQQAPAAKAAATPAAGMGAGGMMTGDMGRMMATMHAGHGMSMGMPMRHMEGRIAFLKAELKITPAQEPQWSTFTQAVRASAKPGQAMMMPGMIADKSKAQTAPAQLNSQEQMLVSRLETIRTIKAAFTPLYTALSDGQKKTADELLVSPMGLM